MFSKTLLFKKLFSITHSTFLYDRMYSIPDFPDRVHIEITNRCNGKCIMCPMRTMTRKQGDMSFDTFRKIVDEAVAREVKQVGFHIAGEPLLHKDVQEMIGYAKEGGIPTTQLTTNAALLTREKAKQILSAGIDEILITIDGGEKELYERIRGIPFEKVISNLHDLLSLLRTGQFSKPDVRVMTIEFPDVREATKNFISDWRQISSDLPNVTIEWKKFANMSGQIPSNSVDELVKMRLEPIRNSYKKPSLYEQLLNNKPILCAPLYNSIDIHWDGNVTACCRDMDRHISLGNVTDSSLYEIWHGERMQEMHQHFRHQEFDLLPSLCQLCIRNS